VDRRDWFTGTVYIDPIATASPPSCLGAAPEVKHVTDEEYNAASAS
jgi:hypothetical protein